MPVTLPTWTVAPSRALRPGFDEAGPERRFGAVDDEQFERAAAAGAGGHARGDDAGVVEHGEVAGGAGSRGSR